MLFDLEVKLKFCKAKLMPYALRNRVEEELDRLERQGVQKRVKYSKWALPIVTVVKDAKDPLGPIRICGDYKVAVNKAAPVDSYPLPNTIDLLAMLAVWQKFTKFISSWNWMMLLENC